MLKKEKALVLRKTTNNIIIGPTQLRYALVNHIMTFPNKALSG